MATSSTIPAVKAALVSIIGASLATSGAGSTAVQVTYGHPGENQLDRECVYVGDVTGSSTIPVFKGTGRKVRQEDYSVEVVVWVDSDTGIVSVNEARAFALLVEVEDALADNSATLNSVDGVIHVMAGDFRVASDQRTTGPASIIVFNVDVLARLA